MPDDLGIAGAGNPAVVNDGVTQAPFEVPQAYAEKGWSKDLKSFDDVYKKLDGAQELIGKRSVPDANSTPEDWEAHYKTIGRPEDAGKYTFNRETFSKEFQESQNEEYDNAIKGIFLKAGLNQRQVDIIQPEVEKLADAIQTQGLKDKAEADTAADKAFDEAADKAFGTNRVQIISDTAAMLKENTPKGFEEKVASLDDDTLVILSGVLNSVKTKYINEDGSGGGAGGGTSGETVDDLRQKARTIMQTDEYRNSFNSKSDEKRKEVADIYERIAKLNTQ